MRTLRTLVVGALFAGALVGCDDSSTAATGAGASTVAAGAKIALAGEDNLRDLGGYVGADGRRILSSRLFRSGELSALTEADRSTLSGLGLEQVIDLRTSAERAEKPDALPAGVDTAHIPLSLDVATSTSSQQLFMTQVATGQIDGRAYMTSFYALDSIKLANWPEVFDILEAGRPTLWHCTAGKDRAGMTTALVLLALGVDSATVMEDFLKTNTYTSAYIEGTVHVVDSTFAAKGITGAGERLRPVLGVEAVFLDAFFASIRARGGVSKVLGELGVDTLKLRSLYLEAK